MRYSDYHSPSWSWVSINGPVHWPYQSVDLELAHVEDVQIRVPGQNPYGAVTGGWIRLRGLLIPVDTTVDEDGGKRYFFFDAMIDGRFYKSNRGVSTRLDCQNEQSEVDVREMVLFFFPLHWIPAVENKYLWQLDCCYNVFLTTRATAFRRRSCGGWESWSFHSGITMLC